MSLYELVGLHSERKEPSSGDIAGHWKKAPTPIVPRSPARWNQPSKTPPDYPEDSNATISEYVMPRRSLNPRKLPKNIKNPYDRRAHVSGQTANPSARQTVTDLQINNRPRSSRQAMTVSEAQNRSRYFSFEPQHQAPSATFTAASSSRTSASARRKRRTTSSYPSDIEIIEADDVGPDATNSKERFKQMPPPDELDELDLIENKSAPSPSRHLKGKTDESRTNSGLPNVLSGMSKKPTQPHASNGRAIAADGESTSRMKKKLAKRRRSLSSSPITSPANSPLPEHTVERTDPDEVGATSSLRKNMKQLDLSENLKTTSKQFISQSGHPKRIKTDHSDSQPSSSKTPLKSNGIRPGTVKSLANMFQKEPQIPHIDLKKASVSQRMKMKDGQIPSTTKILDRSATAATAYKRPFFSVAVNMCVWGEELSENVGESTTPNIWLKLDEEECQLQLIKGSKAAKPHRHLSFFQLKNAVTTGNLDYRSPVYLKIDLSNSADVPDDVKYIGVFICVLPNQDQAFDLYSRLDKLVHRSLMDGTVLETQQKLAQMRREEFQKQQEVIKREERLLEESKVSGMANERKATVGLLATSTPKSKPVMRPTAKHTERMEDDEKGTAKVVRRSGRLSADSAEHQTTPINSDEIILVYPPTGIGAVNVTATDLRRLEPSEFLNDTIIELGLKFWLNDLRETQPERAEEVHVFSSFFYKKLNNRNFADGYKSVRKWTAKVDIFKKKYIIVPINENFHWYLAIIYRPDHILERTRPKATPRSSKRRFQEVSSSSEKANSGLPANASLVENLSTSLAPSIIEKATDGEREDDAAVEEVIQITRDCSIEDEASDEANDGVLARARSPSTQFEYPAQESVSEDNDSDSGMKGTLEGGGRSPEVTEVIPDSETDEVDELVDDDYIPQEGFSLVSSQSYANLSEGPQIGDLNVESTKGAGARKTIDVITHIKAPDTNKVALSHTSAGSASRFAGGYSQVNGSAGERERRLSAETPVQEGSNQTSGGNEHRVESGKNNFQAVPSSAFYGTQAREIRTYAAKGKEVERLSTNKAIRSNKGDSSLLDDGTPDTSRTWIFGFDSLGSKHPAALKRLNSYLRAEAEDKKGITDPDDALMKMALPLYQPNFCDCGLYLLHFATTFLSDPEKYMKIAASTKKIDKEAGEKVWRGDEVIDLRERLKARILSEAERWKKMKVTTEKAAKQAESSVASSSDDEIEVSEVQRRGPTGYTPNKRIKRAPAENQPTVRQASRLRG